MRARGRASCNARRESALRDLLRDTLRVAEFCTACEQVYACGTRGPVALWNSHGITRAIRIPVCAATRKLHPLHPPAAPSTHASYQPFQGIHERFACGRYIHRLWLHAHCPAVTTGHMLVAITAGHHPHRIPHPATYQRAGAPCQLAATPLRYTRSQSPPPSRLTPEQQLLRTIALLPAASAVSSYAAVLAAPSHLLPVLSCSLFWCTPCHYCCCLHRYGKGWTSGW